MKKRKEAGAPGAMVVIISGPSGVGKDTIIRLLMERHPPRGATFRCHLQDEACRVVTRSTGVTTTSSPSTVFASCSRRAPCSRRARSTAIGRAYRATRSSARSKSGCDALLRIDVQGADKIKALIPDAVRIFVAPPSVDVQRRRLAGRGTESAEEQAKRNLDAEAEMARAADFDYVVVNETDQPDGDGRPDRRNHPARTRTGTRPTDQAVAPTRGS